MWPYWSKPKRTFMSPTSCGLNARKRTSSSWGRVDKSKVTLIGGRSWSLCTRLRDTSQTPPRAEGGLHVALQLSCCVLQLTPANLWEHSRKRSNGILRVFWEHLAKSCLWTVPLDWQTELVVHLLRKNGVLQFKKDPTPPKSTTEWCRRWYALQPNLKFKRNNSGSVWVWISFTLSVGCLMVHWSTSNQCVCVLFDLEKSFNNIP